jgi:cob(I)alamin adenosyltransferase
MVRLNKIYTRTGDDGSTALGDGRRRKKNDPRIIAYGSVDETNSAIGLARLSTQGSSHPDLLAIERVLARAQNDLFDLGADLCVPEERKVESKKAAHAPLRVTKGQVAALEHAIDALNADLSPLRSFVLPAGSSAAAALHLARSICRRAERDMVALAQIKDEKVGEAALAYINRLSDYLFVAARFANGRGGGDVLWVPGAGRRD